METIVGCRLRHAREEKQQSIRLFMLYKSTVAKSGNPFVLDPFSVDDMTALSELRQSVGVYFHHESEDDSITGWCNVYQSERELTQDEQTVLYLAKF